MKDIIQTENRGKNKLQEFEGHMTIQFFDKDTGEEVDRIESKNRFTLALDNLINKMPYAMNSGYAVTADDGRNMYAGTSQPTFPLSFYGLSGIICYSQKINENQSTDDPFYEFTQDAVAFASREAYSGEESRRGNMDTTSSGSGPIENGTGYRFVYDWTASQGNGTIRCVCLTSVDGGKSEFGAMAETNYRRKLYASNGGFRPILFTDDGVYHVVYSENKLEVYFIKLGNSKIGVNDAYPLNFDFANYKGELVHTFDFGSNLRYYYYAGHGSEIIVVAPSSISGTTQTLTVYKWDVSTDAATSVTVSIGGEGGVFAFRAEDAYCGYDGTNVYLAGNEATSDLVYNLIRVNLTNNADVEFIAIGASSNITYDGGFAFVGDDAEHGYVSGRKFMYFPTKNTNNVILRSEYSPFAVGRMGVYNLYYGDSYSFISAGVLSPYLATINNLSEARTKDATRSMRITYDVKVPTENAGE